jgi:hypothetical protein
MHLDRASVDRFLLSMKEIINIKTVDNNLQWMGYFC